MLGQTLNGEWTLLEAAGRSRIPARVPGTLLGALTSQGLIDDPYDGLNEEAAKALFEKDYTFERVFTPDAQLLCQAQVDLVMAGLDTLAQVSLNDTPILTADNMHRTYRVPVKALLRKGENLLRVRFSSPLRYINEQSALNPDITYTANGNLHGTSFIRKAHSQFGWDWGPQLPDCGIWRDIGLEGYTTRIEEVRIHQEMVGDDMQVTVQAAGQAAKICLYAPDGTLCAQGEGEKIVLAVKQPQLWWPNGLGSQPLYRLEIASGEEKRTLRLGLRTMTVSRERDEWGAEFAFQVNGVRFFAMGADYIPEDSIFERITQARTRQLLKDCADAHFNCVRVWGGGAYPDEAFYDACDEMGLVVWQDLMFACNIYKMTDAFEASIVAETTDVLQRIRHHACLGLLCGNNEMEMGWLEWDNVSCHSPVLKADYLKQFEFVLKRVCLAQAPDVFWWPSSPSSGGSFDQPNDQNRGDVHDWSVWHGRQPFTDFQKRYPRFCSEFGFESLPSLKTLESFAHSPQELNPFSQVMENHQKCDGGNGTMLYYLSQYLPYPYSLDGLCRATQFLQGEAMRYGVEHWRRSRGRCMGAIYWQLNDCWPTASWASIDYFGRWKALHYMAKRFFDPVLLSCQRKESQICLNVSNETRAPFTGTVCWLERDAAGRVLSSGREKVTCPPLCSMDVLQKDMPGSGQRVLEYLLTDAENQIVSRGEELFCAPKHFDFQKPHVQVHLENENDQTVLTLQTDVFCMAVCLTAGEARFTDNWFALYPGEPRTVRADRVIAKENLRVQPLCAEEDPA